MTLDTLMRQLITEFSLDQTSASCEADVWTLLADEGKKITLALQEEQIHVQCNVIPCPQEKREAIFHECMQANLLENGTKGCVVGLTPDGSTLTLSKMVDHNIDYEEFRDLLEEFLNTVDGLKMRVNS